jgi:hypothetical protein
MLLRVYVSQGFPGRKYRYFLCISLMKKIKKYEYIQLFLRKIQNFPVFLIGDIIVYFSFLDS